MNKKSIYSHRRYWYHLSSTLKHNDVLLKPRDNAQGFNRTWNEPDDERICVAPSIAHCLTAIPYCPGDTYRVYRTKSKVKASKPSDVFDCNVTLEGWIQKPTVFTRIGTLTLEDVERGEKMEYIVDSPAGGHSPQTSGKALRWWKKRNLWKYVKRTKKCLTSPVD